MKYKRLVPLALLAPLTLLCGCGGSVGLSFSPNWFYENTVENITGKSETLEYDVSFRNTSTGDLSVHYEKGSYITSLQAENLTVGENTLQVYHLHTDYAIDGMYEWKGVALEAFRDTMVTDVWYMTTSYSLQPIKSEKRVHATVPTTNQGTDNFYVTYEFTYNVSYAEDLSEANYELEITAPEAQKKTETDTVDLSDSGTFLDNEEILMALRGLTVPSTGAAFRSIDPQTRREVSLAVSTEAVNIAVSFDCNGEKVEGNLDANQLTCSYTSSQPGPSRRFLFAARKDEASKRYRNVLLRFENPVMYSLGTMTYTLRKATFNDR